MVRSLQLALMISLMVYSAEVSAAKWDKNGHPKITYEVAVAGGFGFTLPTDIAKVMALGSVAPDYFDFENPPAHSQTPDPPVEIGPKVYEDLQRKAYRAAAKWRRFYFDAAVTALQKGRREQAAFLLGYALHNAEDFATHGGVSNIVHAGRAAEGKDPDKDIKRLAKARSLAGIEIERFRRAVGEVSWAQFKGKSVRKPGSRDTIPPEPLSTFGDDLKDWDPRAGALTARREHRTLKGAADSYINYKMASLKLRAPEAFHTYHTLFNDLVWGLYDRQEAMVGLLDVTTLGIEWPIDGPKRPEIKGQDKLFSLAFEALRFGVSAPDPSGEPRIRDYPGQAELELRKLTDLSLPLQYRRLSPEKKAMFGNLIWDDLMVEELNNLKRTRASNRADIGYLLGLDINDLRIFRQRYQRWAAQQRKLERIDREVEAEARAKKTRLATVRPPRYDAHPPPVIRKKPSVSMPKDEPYHAPRSEYDQNPPESTYKDSNIDFNRIRGGIRNVLPNF